MPDGNFVERRTFCEDDEGYYFHSFVRVPKQDRFLESVELSYTSIALISFEYYVLEEPATGSIAT